jgi:hypothetical protein
VQEEFRFLTPPPNLSVQEREIWRKKLLEEKFSPAADKVSSLPYSATGVIGVISFQSPSISWLFTLLCYALLLLKTREAVRKSVRRTRGYEAHPISLLRSGLQELDD